MKEGIWYYYDPDNRKDEPLLCSCFCIRCKKKFRPGKPANSTVRVVLHPEPFVPWVRLLTQKEWEEWRDSEPQKDAFWHDLGPECFKKLEEMEPVKQ